MLEEFKKFVDSEITRWGELVEKAGILHAGVGNRRR